MPGLRPGLAPIERGYPEQGGATEKREIRGRNRKRKAASPSYLEEKPVVVEKGRWIMFALMPWKKRAAMPLPRAETPFRWFPEEFENLFNRFLTPFSLLETAEWPYRWGLTMEEKEKEVVVRVELPGFTPEEVKVELLGEKLVIEAEHKEPEKKEEGKEKEEAKYAHVKRELTLPPEVELEKAEALYKNGVLEVHLPRKPEAVGRKIEVKT